MPTLCRIAGYTGSVFAQEGELTQRRVILLGPDDLVSELIAASLLCSRAQALAETAVRLAAPECKYRLLQMNDLNSFWDDSAVCGFSDSVLRVDRLHCVSFHADGHILPEPDARELFIRHARFGRHRGRQNSRASHRGGYFRTSFYFLISNPLKDSASRISVDGMPADSEVGGRSFLWIGSIFGSNCN